MTNLSEIKKINELAFHYLNAADFSQIEDGRHELGSGVYVNIESYETQKRIERKFESHEKYIDIQYMIRGEEIISVAPVDELEVSEPYNEDRDITFYKNCINGKDYLITDNEFLIIRPGEGHMPCIAVNSCKRVRKAVVKVPVQNGDNHEKY